MAQDDWITTQEAAEISGYHRVYISELARLDKIKAQRFGQSWQISRSSLLAYLKLAGKSEDKRQGPRVDRA
jgi:excisionase family DNA binding protein